MTFEDLKAKFLLKAELERKRDEAVRLSRFRRLHLARKPGHLGLLDIYPTTGCIVVRPVEYDSFSWNGLTHVKTVKRLP